MGSVLFEITELGVRPLLAGDELPAGTASVFFDHAAMVAAGRSRADGFDFWVSHDNAPFIQLVDASGLNTVSCEVGIVLPFQIDEASTMSGFTLHFGNLGAQTNPFTGFGTSPTGLWETVYNPPDDLVLPPPSFHLPLGVDHDTVEMASASKRVGRRNQNPTRRWSAEWRGITPEDFYSILAFVNGTRGVEGFAAPSWIGGTETYVVVPESFAHAQHSRTSFEARLEIETVPV